MATGFYIKGKDNIGKGQISLTTDEIVVALVDTSKYSVDLANDEFQDAIPDDAIIAERTLIATQFDANVFDADDLLFPQLETGHTIGAFVIIKNTGDYNTSLLICYIDNAPELPVTTDDSDFTIQWDNGTNKIFKL